MEDTQALSEAEVEQLVRRFNALYCQNRSRTWGRTSWLGRQVMKCPLDLWVYQEALFQRRPDVIIETGTRTGAATHFLATIFDQIGNGRLITVDVLEIEDRLEHPRITYLTGSSIDPEIVAGVRDSIGPDENVMVILDALHQKDFVLQELAAYAPLVGKRQMLVVEDTNINWWTDAGPGPAEAVEEFLATELGSEFRVVPEYEKFFMTFNPGGYLVRR
jgi:cephalosporin hydroxylase